MTTHCMTGTPEYQAFTNARARCEYPKAKGYKYYGGRGIKFLFPSFDVFFAELGYRPSPAHSVDRIITNGHYEVGNVRWATPAVQQNNRRNNGVVKKTITIRIKT